MEKTMRLPADFRDLLYEFNAATAEYLIIGAFAMADDLTANKKATGRSKDVADVEAIYKRLEETSK